MLTLQSESLDWALKHALNKGDTDVFPAPFEFQALEHDWDRVRPQLLAQNVLEWTTRPPRTLLAPKAKYAFRAITQLDPIDFLLYSALVYEIADDLEIRRISVPESRVFSYRVATNLEGQLFDPEIGYRQFIERCQHELADPTQTSWVATADISDFYSRIYHHRLENTLHAATAKTSHVKAIMHLLSGWNGTETFGIPVGCAPSRMLAELTLSDIDSALLANGIDFIRFNDDYRIFCSSKTESYQQVTILADTLFKNHGLSLQPQKTHIYKKYEFVGKFLSTPLDREMDSLHERFHELVEEIGLESWYEEIEYDDLTPDQQSAIDQLNLVGLIRSDITSDDPDLPVVKFCLRRLGQLGDDSVVDDIFDNLESLTPVFVDVIRYFAALRHLDESNRSALGTRLLELLNNSIVSALPYHRMWILHVFTESTEWDNEDKFLSLYNREPHQACKRSLVLALGRSQQTHWFQSQWRSLFDHSTWERRAVLAGSSCMPPDARKHWYRSVDPQLDILELAVVRWVRQYPFEMRG